MPNSNQRDFVATYGPLAGDIAQATGLDPSVVLGISAQETGWGKHVSGSNLFGISPTGPQGQYVAQYPDASRAGQAFADLMQTPRYAAARRLTDPDAQAAAITAAGYNSVDPTYAASITAHGRLIRGMSGQPGIPSMPPASAAASSDVADGRALFQSMTGKGPAPAAAVNPDVADGQALFRNMTAGAGAAGGAPAQGAPAATPSVRADGSQVPAYDANVDTPLPPAYAGGGALPPPSAMVTKAANALAPAPGTTYGNVLPFATDDKTGAVRLALPNAIRDTALSALHLLQSPSTGTLTPADSATLAGIVVPNPLARAADLPGIAGAKLLPSWTPEGIRYLLPGKAAGSALPPPANLNAPRGPSGWEVPPEQAPVGRSVPAAAGPAPAQNALDLGGAPSAAATEPNALRLGPDGKPVAPVTAAPPAATPSAGLQPPPRPTVQPGMGAAAPAAGPDTGTVTTSAGRKVDVRYEVVPADSLTAASGDLQPRDRSNRVASDAQVQDISANLDPARLMRSPDADRGAPIVGPDGTIESGNGRVQAINRAAQQNPAAYAAYVQALRDAGHNVDGIDRPVLVARRTTDLSPEDRRAFVVEANQSATARMSPAEQAAIDGNALTSDMLGRYDSSKEPTAAANRDFVRSWVGTLPEAERNAVMDAQGELSADGVRRLGGAMLARAYGDKGILARGLESTDDNIRSVSGALAGAAPAWARLRAGVENGSVPPEFDVSGQLSKAADLVRVAREKGRGLNDILGQQDAFNPLDPVTAGFVRSFYNADGTRTASRASIIDTLQRYADEAQRQGGGASMFGDTVTPQQSLNAVLSRRQPVPESAGAAATPSDLTGIEKRLDLAYRSVAERGKLNETQPTGPDRNLYIDGVIPTTAQVEQSVALAREEKSLGIRNTEASAEAKDLAASNNEKRQQFLQNEIIPSKVQVIRQREATEAQIQREKAAAFDNRKPVSAEAMQGVSDTITQKLTDLQGAENTQLQKFIKPLQDRLVNRDGSFKDDALQLYGLRQDINRMRSKESQSQDKNLIHVAGELGDIIETLDGAIESGAPGYRAYMRNTSANLQRLDAMEVLRAHESDFYDAQNRIQYSRVQRVMRDIVESRDMPGNIQNGYKHIPQDVLEKLWALRDDTRRVATARELAATPGSDTAQNLWDTVKGVAGGVAGNTVAHAVANATLGPLGSAAVNIGKAALGSMREGKQGRADLARARNLLHVDPSTLRRRPDNALDAAP